jgi:hypothetical protein
MGPAGSAMPADVSQNALNVIALGGRYCRYVAVADFDREMLDETFQSAQRSAHEQISSIGVLSAKTELHITLWHRDPSAGTEHAARGRELTAAEGARVEFEVTGFAMVDTGDLAAARVRFVDGDKGWENLVGGVEVPHVTMCHAKRVRPFESRNLLKGRRWRGKKVIEIELQRPVRLVGKVEAVD